MKTRSILSLLAVQLISALYNVLLKRTVSHNDDVEKPPNLIIFTLVRDVICTFVLALMAYSSQLDWKSSVSWSKEWRRYLLLGLFGIAGNQLFFIFGLPHISATTAAILIHTTPIFVFVIGMSFGIESISMKRVIGMLVSICGACLVITFEEIPAEVDALVIEDLGSAKLYGAFLLLMSNASVASYYFLQKPLLQAPWHMSPVVAALVMYIVGTIMVLVVAIVNVPMEEWCLSNNDLYTVVFAAIFPSVVTTTLESSVNRDTPVSVFSLFNSLLPIVTALTGFLLYGDVMGWNHVFGVLVIGGILLVMQDTHSEQVVEGKEKDSQMV